MAQLFTVGGHSWTCSSLSETANGFILDQPLRVATTAGAGAIVLAAGQRTIWADEFKAPAPKKLPIYSPPEPEVLLVPTESELVDAIGRTRRILVRAGEDSRDGVQGIIGRWIQVERRIESRIKSLISPEEPVTPGVLYVGVAALSGSVYARGRSLPTRLLLPPALFERAAEFQERAASVVQDVQSKLAQAKPEAKLSPPAGLLAKSKEEKDLMEKVEEVVQDVRAEAAAALGVAKEKVDPKNEEPKHVV
ncbi:hypothetical protein FS749_016705 [Ceratobasidium sp. UAMH 11750]|nr:hypothetical protein FS749_016705 [Ceratobasidium sp. UAMH 11750]